MTASVTLDSGVITAVVGAVLTLCGLAIITFITFFLRRLVNQLDRNSDINESIGRSLVTIETRLTALEHKTSTVVTVKGNESIPESEVVVKPNGIPH